MAKDQQARIIFGLKLRQFRQGKGWNFEEMSRQSGISVSYLNEIEKGKKFPQPDNIERLAKALDVTPESLSSSELTHQLAPVGELLNTNFLSELPLDRFGIDVQQVIEIIAKAPDRVNAFISAMLEIARNYSVRQEHFYFAALRAYQELHGNYFPEIEQAAADFAKAHSIPNQGEVSASFLRQLLEKKFNYTVDTDGLVKYPELSQLRSVYIPKRKKLLLNGRLAERQQAFQLAKEIGFNVLGLKERPLAGANLRAESFDVTLNNYLAAYFAVALLIDQDAFVRDLDRLFESPKWEPERFQAMLGRYGASPEVAFQRFNVLVPSFNIQKLFFLRIIHHTDTGEFEIDKELHLNRRHQPHASGLNEHYCRRWLSLTVLNELKMKQQQTDSNLPVEPVMGAQRAVFADTDEPYLWISVAKPGYPVKDRNISITLGLLMDDTAKEKIKFYADPSLQDQTVNVTCERCSIMNCAQRAAPPRLIERREARKATLIALKKVTGEK